MRGGCTSSSSLWCPGERLNQFGLLTEKGEEPQVDQELLQAGFLVAEHGLSAETVVVPACEEHDDAPQGAIDVVGVALVRAGHNGVAGITRARFAASE